MTRDMMLTIDEYLALRRLIESERESEGAKMASQGTKKKKRKVSKYAKAYGANYKKLKKKHPRSKHATLVTKAHAATRKEMKKK